MTKLGTAFFDVRPDTGGFTPALRAQMATAIAAVSKFVKLQPDLDAQGLEAKVARAVASSTAGRKLAIPVEPRTEGFRFDLDREVARAAAGIRAQIGTEADTAGYRIALKAAVARSAAGIRAEVGIDVNAAALRAELTRAVRGAGAALPVVPVAVRPDTTGLVPALRSQLLAASSVLGGPTATLGVGLGAAFVAGLGGGALVTAKLEKGLSAVRAAAGATEDQMEAVRAKALELGADTAFSASQAVGAIEELVKAGLSVEQVLNGAADAAVSLAAAGGVSLETAATIAANAVNSFSLGGDQITKVADTVAGAANASAIGVDDFALSLSQAGAVANLAGLSFGDTATAIALMGNAGIRGSDAGTSLKTMLQNLIPVTEREKNLFRELGIVTEEGGNRFFDAQGRVKGLADISQVLQEATRGQTEQQKLFNLSILFGSDALRAAGILTKAGAGGVRELNAEMRETTAAEAAAIRMDNLAGSFEEFKGSLETVLILIGTPLQSGLRSVVDFGTRSLNVLGDLGAGGGLVAETFGQLVDIGADLVQLLGNVASAGAPAVAVVAQLGGGTLLVGLNALADVLGPIASLLAENETAADLLAAVLVGRLGLAVVRLIGASGLAGLTTGLVTAGRTAVATGALMIQLEGGMGATKAAALGLGAALKAIGPGIAITAATFGIINVVQSLDKAEASAKKLADRLTGEGLTSNSLDVVSAAAKRVGEEALASEARYDKAGKGWVRSIKETVQAIGPWEETISKAGEAMDGTAKRADELAGRTIHLNENIIAVRSATGLSAEAVGILADKLRVDLGGPFKKTTERIVAGAKEMGQALLVSAGDVKKAFALTEADAKAAEELASGLASSFDAAANIAGQFSSKLNIGTGLSEILNEQAGAAKDLVSSTDAARQSQRDLSDAQRGVAAAQRQLNTAIAEAAGAHGLDELAERNERVAREQEQLASAQARQADAQGELADAEAKLSAARKASSAGLLGSLRTQLVEAQSFQQDISKLITAGIDPALVRELAEQGPELAGAAVRGVLAEVQAGNAGAINATVTSLRETRQAVKGQSLAFFREQLAEQQAFGTNLKKLVDAGLDPELVRKVALAGPEAGAGAAAALVADVGAGKVNELNASQAALRTGFSDILTVVTSYTGPLNVATQRMLSDAFGGVTVDDPVAGIRADLARALSPASLFSGVDTEKLRALASDIGQSISDGIGAGVSKPNPALAAGIKAITGGLVKSAKESARIQSPSRLFADEVGGPIVAGIALGMREQMASVVAQAEAIVAQAARVTAPSIDVPSLAGAPVPAGRSSLGWEDRSVPTTSTTTYNTTNNISNPDPNAVAEAIGRTQARDAARAR